MSKIVIKCFTR